jgi:hypothetical protein
MVGLFDKKLISENEATSLGNEAMSSLCTWSNLSWYSVYMPYEKIRIRSSLETVTLGSLRSTNERRVSFLWCLETHEKAKVYT